MLYNGGEGINIIISNANNQAIYSQIYEQIKVAIVAGKLKEGELLPSIRQLAKDLRISVITTKRAYEELEREQYIYPIPGKGYYVAKKNIELIKEVYLKEIEEYMQKIYELAAHCNLSSKEILEMFCALREEED